jgi:hypothetical protein
MELCANCNKPVGAVPHTIKDRPEKFCSSECSATQFSTPTKRRKEKNMQVPALDFGGEVSRHFCDNPNCRKPYMLCWKGHDGEYCSPDCKDAVEDPNYQGDHMSDNETAAPEAPANKPITAAAPKKSKKAPAKKSEPKKAKSAKKATAKKAPKTAAKTPEKGSKAAIVTALMERKNGATADEIIAATGWSPKTVLNFVFYHLKRAGINAESFKNKQDERTYRIAK